MSWEKSKSQNSHTHINKTALDRLGVNPNNKLTIDNIEQSGETSTNQTSKLSGLKWACLGDSITQVTYPADSYHKIIADKTGIVNLNYGVNSTTIGKRNGRTDSMLERYVDMDSTADIITVLGGTNDWGSATPVPLGTMGNGDEFTFYGACESLVVGLINKYPNKPIGLMTPIARGYTSSGGLKPYATAIKEVGNKYCIPVLDLYNESGLSVDIPYMVTNYFYAQDKLHPNTEGAKIISRQIRSFLERIIG